MLAGFAIDSMVAATSEHTSRFHVDPNTARVLTDFAYPLTFETALPLAAPVVLATSLLALRRRFLPRWLGWTGVVVAFGCILGVLGFTMALFLAWIVVVAVFLILRPSVLEPADAAAAPVT